jgi:molecular chaperone DnaK
MGSSEIILGIDLGTSYSTAAAMVGGKVVYALDSRGEARVPSVVHFPKRGLPVVGAEAEKMRATDAENTIFGIKRLVGRASDSPAGRLLDACSAFKIRAGRGNEASVLIRGSELQASEIASIILRHLRDLAEARLGRGIRKAILTCPVSATPQVRDALARCGKMAGLDVLGIVNEPCAGSLSRGLAAAPPEGEPQLVYDFGGGTFDATVVQRVGGAMKVLSAAGDDCLGGDDLDLAFARWIGDGVHRMHHKDVVNDAVLWDRLQRTCERVKRALSVRTEARLVLPDAYATGGQDQNIDTVVRREVVERLWKEFVIRSLQVSVETARKAGVLANGLGSVLLIGGTSFVPQVRSSVEAIFQLPTTLEPDPQTAVARGAALLAAQPSLLTV